MNTTAPAKGPPQDSPRKKSPRCPSMSLSEGLDRAQRVYEKEARHEAPADVVAQDMGYTNSKSGAAAQTLASMSYFGLLVRPNDGKLAVAREVEEYKFAPQDSQKQELIRKWLRTPPIYSELLDKYATGLPSDATLKYDFIQKGFNAKVADIYVAAFRQSVDFAKYYETKSKDLQPDEPEFGNVETFHSSPIPPERTPSSAPRGGRMLPQMEMAEHDSIPVRLPGGRKAVLIIPSPFYEADKIRLKAQIDSIYAEEANDDAPLA